MPRNLRLFPKLVIGILILLNWWVWFGCKSDDNPVGTASVPTPVTLASWSDSTNRGIAGPLDLRGFDSLQVSFAAHGIAGFVMFDLVCSAIQNTGVGDTLTAPAIRQYSKKFFVAQFNQPELVYFYLIAGSSNGSLVGFRDFSLVGWRRL